VEKRGLF
jgi:adenylate kinase